MDVESKPNTQDAVDSVVLEEEIDPNYVPSEPEVVEYAKWMGMDLDKDQDLFWIAREGLMAPLPKDWKPCRTKDTEDIYYFNFSTGDSTWDHPCDGYYKRLYEEEKKKKETVIKESGDQNRSKAKQDVEQLLGRADKKKSKKVTRTLSDIDMVKALPAPLGLQKAPLPGINNPLRMSAPSSLGPLSSGGATFGDALGSIGKKNSLLKGSELGLKVSSSLDGSRLVSSRDPSPSPMSRAQPVELADIKSSEQTARQRAEQKDRDEDARGSDDGVYRDIGRLDVTSSLSSKSRMLGGSAGAAASKLRAALPGGSAVDSLDERRRSPSEEKSAFEDRSDSKALEDKPDRHTDFSEDRATSRPLPQHASTSSPDPELERCRSRCAELERRAEENEARVADYKASYSTAKDDLAALERRYETNQTQWLDRVRALEVEKDKVESERRQLKLTLLDLETTAKTAPEQSAVDSNAEQMTKMENVRLKDEIAALQMRLHVSESALAQSAVARSELQETVTATLAEESRRASQLESQHSATQAVNADLTRQLEECRRDLSEARASAAVVASTSAAGSAQLVEELQRALLEQKDLNGRCEAEMQRLRTLLVSEQARCSEALEAKEVLWNTLHEQLRVEGDRAAALQQQLTTTLAALASARSEIATNIVRNNDSANDLAVRAEAAERSLLSVEAVVSGLRAAETALKSDLAERDRKLSDQQEQILALQASSNLNANTDSEKSAQFEVFVSQATAIRKSLKSEIERQKLQILELETEKSALVTQLTRQETTLQFAKKELNGVASLTESNRQLDVDKQLLTAQLEAIRGSSARQAEQEFQLREKYEQMLQTRHEEGELARALKQDNERLMLTLEQERAFGAQSEKKIKSYQEELLQLQRRLAEDTSPLKTLRALSAEEPSYSAAVSHESLSPTRFAEQAATVLELQNQFNLKQAEVNRVEQELAKCASDLRASQEQALFAQKTVLTLTQRVSELQEQLRAAALQISDAGADQRNLFEASAKERDRLEQEKMIFESQLQSLRSQVSAANAKLEFSNINVQRLEAEVNKYRDKWLASEAELTTVRLARGDAGSAGTEAEAELGSLRAELREAQASVEQSHAAEQSMRSQVLVLRKALEEKSVVVQELRANLLTTIVPAGDNKENVESAAAGLRPESNQEHLFDIRQMTAHQSSLSQQHIVALSLEVGRQQATMERLEQHIRNTEVVLDELKSQGKKDGPAISAPRHLRAAAERAEDEAARESSTPESQQSLLLRRAAGKGESSSPARRNRNKQLQQHRTAKSVQFQFHAKDNAYSRAADADPSGGLVELIDIKDKVAALVEEMDMDVHDCTTLSGGSSHQQLISTAQRVLMEGKTRLRKEAKFLKEVQAVCLSAKDSISHNQECVKRLKSAWRSAKNDSRGGSSTSGLTTEHVNSVTLKVNHAVDELRDTQQLTKTRENRTKSLQQSVQYLEQLLSQQDGREDRSHLVDIMHLVQEKCVEAAAELEGLASAHRAKGGPQGGGRSGQNARLAARGVAFFTESAGQQQRVESVADERGARRYGASASGELPISDRAENRLYQSVPLQPPPPSSPARTRSAHYASMPSFDYYAGPPIPISVPSSASVSGMRNSELKNRLLQEQIAKITERQSLSKAVCEKHAGWLSDLGKEITGAAHGRASSLGAAAATTFSSSGAIGRPAAATDPFASSLQTYKSRYGGKQEEQLSQHSRSFGTALQNQQVAASQQAGDVVVDAMLKSL